MFLYFDKKKSNREQQFTGSACMGKKACCGSAVKRHF